MLSHYRKWNKRILKIIFLGEDGVGKTTILKRYVEGKFFWKFPPFIGIRVLSNFIDREIVTRDVTKSETWELHLWDFGSKEYYKMVRHDMIAMVDGIVFVADMTDETSIHALQQWWEDVEFLIKKGTPWIVLLNKNDLFKTNEDSSQIISHLPEPLRTEIHVFQTSAKRGNNITLAIQSLVDLIFMGRATSTRP